MPIIEMTMTSIEPTHTVRGMTGRCLNSMQISFSSLVTKDYVQVALDRFEAELLRDWLTAVLRGDSPLLVEQLVEGRLQSLMYAQSDKSSGIPEMDSDDSSNSTSSASSGVR